MHARSENLHDGARSAPEICDIFMNRRANSSYFHEADDDGIIIARSHRCDVGSCNPESIEQRQIDDFQDHTGVILKVINLALFDRLRVARSNITPVGSCYDYPIVVGFMKIGRVGSTIHENITNFRGAARAIMQIFAARMHAYQRNLIQ